MHVMAQRFTLRIGDCLRTAEAKKDYNKKVFAEIAPRYDFITRALSFWRDASWKRDLIAALPPREAPLCVDLACGTGDIAFLLAEKYPTGRVVGLDITEGMLDLARSRNTYHNVRFVNQDMGCLGFAGGSVDIISGGYALRNAPDLGTAIDEISRVLKPGGAAALLDFSKPAARLPRRLHYWILKGWGGFWGLLLHRNPDVYGYIAESLQCFPDRDRLRRMFRDKGFVIVTSRRYFFGITEMIVVRKIAAQ
jgi:demethylmenaquinone methyltransferase/2-methoxy-6-polyprenyl-1,4-benzoquinol methylase